MRLNFRKISAIGASVLLTGMTMGVAAAASYPAPFVQGGTTSGVAIVYGASAMDSDVLESGNIGMDLQSYMGATSGSSSSVSTSGEIVSLDTSADRIWLNTSLNSVKSTLTSSDLPTVLKDYTFSGNVDSDLTSTIKLIAGNANGAANSGKVIFAKQPRSSNDPVIGISLGTSATSSPLYNTTITFSKAVAFNNSNSEGETIQLFGADFVVSTATDADTLVLYKSAQKETLTIGGNSPASSTTVNIDGTDYEVVLTNADKSTAQITVNGESGTLTVGGNSKKIGGLEIAVSSVIEGSDSIGTTATILAGAEKLTFENERKVTKGSDNTPIDGTAVSITGGANATTELTVTVFAPRTSEDAIAEGESFEDPVFGSFKLEFTGLSSPLDDATRGMISVRNSGDDTMSLTTTDSRGNAVAFDFAHNQSSQYFLGDDSNKTIHVQEMANISEEEYVIVGNEDYGRLLRLDYISNSSSTTPGDDTVKFYDVIAGTSHDVTFSTTEGSGTLTIAGKQYTATFRGDGDDGWVQLKYPTSESSATQLIAYPTIKLKNNALMSLYEPITIDLTSFDLSGTNVTGIKLPDGDGYTTLTLTYSGGGNWTLSGADTTLTTLSNTTYTGNQSTSLTFGKLTYHLNSTATANVTKLTLVNPEKTATELASPAVLVFEGKDDSNAYEAFVISTKDNPAGSRTNGVEVSDVLFSSSTHYRESMQSNSDVTQKIDLYGVLANIDASDDQTVASVSYPAAQVYANIFVGETSASVDSSGTTTGTGSTSLGQVFVKDNEVSSVSAKNLIVVGGSCVNTAAAKLVGGAYCGADWTAATGVGQGQFLIKGYQDSSLAPGKLALLVAGYEMADTVNAATYLINQKPDTSMAWKGNSATSAEQIVEAQ